MKQDNFPTNAVIAVTLNCNSRCMMCDIWQNRIVNEMKPNEYLSLPGSLKQINITGGEPFLRRDLPEVIEAINSAAPKARVVISSNGFLPDMINWSIKRILAVKPSLGVRVSIDGWKKTHDKIRRIPNGFSLAMRSLGILKSNGVRDLGLGFTIMKDNLGDLSLVYDFSKKNNLELSLTMVTDSPIYFGKGKSRLRPDNYRVLSRHLNRVIVDRFRSSRPKDWFRGWFEEQLLDYYLTRQRPLVCRAAEDSFYLDSTGNVFACHIKNWLLGNLRDKPFSAIWQSPLAGSTRLKTKACHDCWMVCSARSSMRAQLGKMAIETLGRKVKSLA